MLNSSQAVGAGRRHLRAKRCEPGESLEFDETMSDDSKPPTASAREPRGALSIRTLCMPADTNQHGDIFGGWLLGQMDIAGGLFASQIADGRTATVAVDAMTFRKPVNVGDVMCIYADLIAAGMTSISIHVEAWVLRQNQPPRILVTEGKFVYVALGEDRKPRPAVASGQ
jgi:acyl-CoA thioesterase YciA